MTGIPSLFFVITFGLLMFISIILFFIIMLRHIFLKQSKLPEITRCYPAEHQPEGMALEKQTIEVGKSIRFRKCTRVRISETGLYLAIRVMYGKRFVFLIPWSEFSHVTETRLYGVNALNLSVGTPEITSIKVYQDLFLRIKPYLSR